MRIGVEQLARCLGQWRDTTAPLGEALAAAVGEALLDGRLRAGSALPAERRMASGLGVSRGTVGSALGRLRDAGLVDTRHGSASVLQLPPAVEHRIAPLSATGHAGSVIDLRRAVPAAPQDVFVEAARRAVERSLPHLVEHGEPGPGIPALRSAIAERYTRQGTATRPEQILITTGARATLTLLAAHLRPRTVVVETPTFPDALQIFHAPGTRLLGCHVATRGWDVDQLAQAFTAARGGLAYLVPDFHNPTGALMPPEVRRAVSRLATENAVTLLADETMRDLDLRDRRSELPRLRGALIVGSMSKSIWGGVRIGWLRGPAALVSELQTHPLAGPLSASPLQQLVALELLDGMEAVVARRRDELRTQRDHLGALLADDPRWSFDVPPGGLALWLRLASAPAVDAVREARERGLALVAGPRFAFDGSLGHHLRVPFTPPPGVLDQIATVLRETTPVPDQR